MAKNYEFDGSDFQNEHLDLFDIPLFTDKDREYYFHLNDSENEVLNTLKSPLSKAYFILLLGYFKVKPVTLMFSWVNVRHDIDYIHVRYFSTSAPRKNISKDVKSGLYKKILELTGFQRFTEQHRQKLEAQADLAVAIRAERKLVFDECVEYLNQHWIALPALYKLQKIVNQALIKEERRLISIFKQELKGNIQSYVHTLLAPDNSTEGFNQLRNQARDFNYSELGQELKDQQNLAPLFKQALHILKIAKISDGNIQLYSELFQHFRTSQLKQFAPAKASIYILSFLCFRYKSINDNLINGFYRGMRKYQKAANIYADVHLTEEAMRIGKQSKKVADILHLLADENTESDAKLLQHIFEILPRSDLSKVADYMSNIELDRKKSVWRYFNDHKATLRRNLRRLFLAIDFDIDESDNAFAQQLALSKHEMVQNSGGIKSIDETLIRPADLEYLYSENDDKSEVDAFLFEHYLYQKIMKALDNDVCYLQHSHQYRPLKDYLIHEKEQAEFTESMSIAMLKVNIDELTTELDKKLNNSMLLTGKRILEGQNKFVIYSNESNSVKWTLSVKNANNPVNNSIFEQFQQIGIIDILRIVNQETKFSKMFTHFQSKSDLSSDTSKADINDIFACILGNGTNFGLSKIAKISDRSFNQLRSAQSNYLRVETLRAANDCIVNNTAKLPIFEYYQISEQGVHGSIDGQKFECRFSSLMARYSPKYFGQDKGVSAMTMVINHVPVNSKIISADEHESHHIFDVIFNNQSEIKPDLLSTDTAGANKYNFAILHFFGYQFAPRYKTFKAQFERMFQLSNNTDSEQEKAPLITLKRAINWSLICKEWQNICRIMISLGQHKSSQSLLIKKLCRYKSNTATLKALAEYDRAIKAQYILEYVDSETLRRHVQRALNRGEAFHQLRRVIAETNGKKFRGIHHGEITLWNECARLISNCVIHYNAQILSKLKEVNEERQDLDNLDALTRISPVAWHHINLSGFYSFAESEEEHDFAELARSIHLTIKKH